MAQNCIKALLEIKRRYIEFQSIFDMQMPDKIQVQPELEKRVTD